MRNRVLLAVGATALVAASCAQPEPQVLSEAPRSVSASEVTSPTATTERDEQPGRFIARCATEADGGTPGLTIFTDGSENVTDHCLSRYYIGVQPAPGALYVPDVEAGTYAPPSETAPTPTTGEQWTPAQPRTDIGMDENGNPLEDGQPGDPDSDDPDSGETDPNDTDPNGTETPTTSPDGTTPTSPTTPPTTGPGETEPGGTDPTESGTTTPSTEPGDSGAPGTGSAEPTAVPTVTEAPGNQQPGPLTSAMSANPSTPLGSADSTTPAGSTTSAGFPPFRWPGSFWPGGPQG